MARIVSAGKIYPAQRVGAQQVYTFREKTRGTNISQQIGAKPIRRSIITEEKTSAPSIVPQPTAEEIAAQQAAQAEYERQLAEYNEAVRQQQVYEQVVHDLRTKYEGQLQSYMKGVLTEEQWRSVRQIAIDYKKGNVWIPGVSGGYNPEFAPAWFKAQLTPEQTITLKYPELTPEQELSRSYTEGRLTQEQYESQYHQLTGQLPLLISPISERRQQELPLPIISKTGVKYVVPGVDYSLMSGQAGPVFESGEKSFESKFVNFPLIKGWTEEKQIPLPYQSSGTSYFKEGQFIAPTTKMEVTYPKISIKSTAKGIVNIPVIREMYLGGISTLGGFGEELFPKVSAEEVRAWGIEAPSGKEYQLTNLIYGPVSSFKNTIVGMGREGSQFLQTTQLPKIVGTQKLFSLVRPPGSKYIDELSKITIPAKEKQIPLPYQ